jgi:hypothetical protein
MRASRRINPKPEQKEVESRGTNLPGPGELAHRIHPQMRLLLGLKRFTSRANILSNIRSGIFEVQSIVTSAAEVKRKFSMDRITNGDSQLKRREIILKNHEAVEHRSE